jgi:hypothetical protein
MVEAVWMTEQLSTVEKSRVDDLLLIVVDETLKQVFKEEGARVIYDFLKNKCYLKREEIPEKSDVFSAGLERLLASAGLVIEKMILRNLYRKIGLEFEEKEGYEFSDYIKELRKRCTR